MGRHDKQGEAISGTSKARGMKALWHPEPLSNNRLSDRADLGLNHYQKKRAPLDRKMERRWECICVREREREGLKKNMNSKVNEREKRHIQRVTMRD